MLRLDRGGSRNSTSSTIFYLYIHEIYIYINVNKTFYSVYFVLSFYCFCTIIILLSFFCPLSESCAAGVLSAIEVLTSIIESIRLIECGVT